MYRSTSFQSHRILFFDGAIYTDFNKSVDALAAGGNGLHKIKGKLTDVESYVENKLLEFLHKSISSTGMVHSFFVLL